jgi:plasmid stabilization system protein ParE
MPDLAVFQIAISRRALGDMSRIQNFIADSSPQNANLVTERLFDAIDRLNVLPRRHPIAIERSRFGRELRQFVESSFRVIYEVKQSQVVVHHVWHTSRKPAKDL